MLLLVSVQSEGSETTTPASLLMDGETLIATKQLPELSGSSPGFIYPWVKVSSGIPKQLGPLLKYIHLEELKAIFSVTQNTHVCLVRIKHSHFPHLTSSDLNLTHPSKIIPKRCSI
ncbi:hypothetical protein AV530_019573 [Patagioenas fasciata monilis]|uniref:Uncharacterized protein n=1 Tax=Patagioenas fasciata monilis TaxID=372326 RepID=A0A1V4JE60_PATFA|nr:hypothetical protein AV530_019573 [Patagioenas fasciata monilis]